jgi:hypothetical protein
MKVGDRSQARGGRWEVHHAIAGDAITGVPWDHAHIDSFGV